MGPTVQLVLVGWPSVTVPAVNVSVWGVGVEALNNPKVTPATRVAAAPTAVIPPAAISNRFRDSRMVILLLLVLLLYVFFWFRLSSDIAYWWDRWYLLC